MAMPLLLAEINWNLLLQQPDTLIVLMVPGATAIIVLGTVIAIQWRKARQAECEARLTEQMIARGFTAEEIRSVLTAGVNRRRTGKAADRIDCSEPAACC
jgi:hypothetical protein